MREWLMGDSKHAKLLGRIRRIRGKLDGIERALSNGTTPFKILQTASACRGALGGLMIEIIEERLRSISEMDTSEKGEGIDDLIDIVRAYLK
jgi:DNA-binding FrmR family transcriptional regulator